MIVKRISTRAGQLRIEPERLADIGKEKQEKVMAQSSAPILPTM